MVVKKEKFGIGKVVIISVAAVLVVVLLLAVVVANGVSQIAQTFIRSNPETIDMIAMIDAASASYDSDSDLILSLLWAKYASGSVGGKVEGSFTGRFTTVKVRSLEKVNLSCVDIYEYELTELAKSINNTGRFAAELNIREQKLIDDGCTKYSEFVADAKNYAFPIVEAVYKCPLRNCQMREKTTEVAGEFIPERIDIRKVEAGSTLNEVKK